MPVGIDGRKVLLPFFIAYVYDALGGKQHPVATVTRWHHTIEHIHPKRNGFQNIGRGTYAHQITRLVGRQNGVNHLNHFVHDLFRLPYSQTTNGVALTPQTGNKLGRLPPQIGITGSLHDREKTLPIIIQRLRAVKTGDTTLQPTMGQFHRRPGITVIRIPGGTLIKSHYNIGADGSLNIYHSLGCKSMPGPVDVRLKGGPLFIKFSSVTQRKNLKAATICQYGLIPPIKTVQSTRLAEYLQTGT